MKRMILALALVLAGCTPGPTPTPTPTPTSPGPAPASSPRPGPNPQGCVQPADPAAHVYHPDRLKVLAPCVRVTGTIRAAKVEADGDFHVRLQVDPGQAVPANSGGFTDWINAKNVSGQSGYLVVEPVCENPVTQADAITTCEGFINPIKVPPVGTHVAATGPWVLDQDHGWLEIHPAASIETR